MNVMNKVSLPPYLAPFPCIILIITKSFALKDINYNSICSF